MEEFFNPVSILLHMLNAALLMAVLYYLLYKPVRKFMNERTARIEAQLEQARQQHDVSSHALEETERQRTVVVAQAMRAASESEGLAQRHAQEIMEIAQREAREIITRAQAEADSIISNAQDALRQQAAQLAIIIAEKLLSHELSGQDQERLINDLLERL